MLRGAGPLDSRELTTAFDNLGLSRSEGAATVHISFSGATLAEKLPEALFHCLKAYGVTLFVPFHC